MGLLSISVSGPPATMLGLTSVDIELGLLQPMHARDDASVSYTAGLPLFTSRLVLMAAP